MGKEKKWRKIGKTQGGGMKEEEREVEEGMWKGEMEDGRETVFFFD